MFKLFHRATAHRSDPLEAHDAQRRGAVLLDVREAHEWRSGHARGARHLPLSSLQQRPPGIPAEAEVHVICASGHRSLAAARALRRAGFTTVYRVRGGTAAWKRAGLPLDR